jgi:hypothetical protein
MEAFHWLVRWLVRIVIATSGIVIVIVISAILYFVLAESLHYLTRSQIEAQVAAQAQFEIICRQQELDSRDFRGPFQPYMRSDRRTHAYNFVWIRMPGETITITVSYLPYDLPYSLSRSLIEHRDAERRKQAHLSGPGPLVQIAL